MPILTRGLTHVSSRVSGPILSPGMKGTGTPPPPHPLEKQQVHPHHKPYSQYHHHQSASDGKIQTINHVNQGYVACVAALQLCHSISRAERDGAAETTCRKPFPCSGLASKTLAHASICLSAP